LLFVGDDWAEDHHDIELQDETGRVLARAKLPEGVAGIARLHAMLGEHLGEHDEPAVVVGIETDRGPWVQALTAAGYQIYAVNPLQAARYRQRHGVSGAKSDAGDAHVLADMVRTDRDRLRPVAGDSVDVEAVKVLTRAHKTLIWERTRHVLRLRHALLEFFPAALVAFEDLSAVDALDLLASAPDPAAAAALSSADHRRAQTCPPPLRRGEGRADRRRAARRASRAAGRGHGRLRGHRTGPGRDTDHPQHRDQDHGGKGRDAFWSAPGSVSHKPTAVGAAGWGSEVCGW
jgi:hypothetical protein